MNIHFKANSLKFVYDKFDNQVLISSFMTHLINSIALSCKSCHKIVTIRDYSPLITFNSDLIRKCTEIRSIGQ
jgi:hypothetical protein